MIDHGPTRFIALSAYGAGNTKRTLSVRLLRRILDADLDATGDVERTNQAFTTFLTAIENT